MMIKKAIILAGGAGTRLRPVTLEIPKPLVPVQGVPILSWLVRLFVQHGVQDVTVIYPTCWKPAFLAWEAQKNQTLQNIGMAHVSLHLFEEKEPMGTMGAIVHELALDKDPVYVTNGDELKGLDLTAFSEFHSAQSQTNPELGASIALVRVPNPSDYGVAEMDGDRITKFHEKPENPPSDLISSGLYILEPTALFHPGFSSGSGFARSHAFAGEGLGAEVGTKFLMLEKDLFPHLAEARRLAGCTLSGQWFDCGTMERWERAITEWRGLDLWSEMS